MFKHEGPTKLMSGATMASSRATLVTIGQVGLNIHWGGQFYKTGNVFGHKCVINIMYFISSCMEI